jgi:hypothetical protein
MDVFNVELGDIINKNWMDLGNIELLDFLFVVNKINEEFEFLDNSELFVNEDERDEVANKLFELEGDVRHKVLTLMS